MIRHIISTILLCAGALFASAQYSLVTADFRNGIPATFTLVDYTDKDVLANDFLQNRKTEEGNTVNVPIDGITPQNTWYASRGVPDHGTLEVPVAMSCSHRIGASSTITDNWMILPQTIITQGTALTWRAKSIHHQLLENYDIYVSTSGTARTNFKRIYSVVEENPTFTRHYVDLSAFAGQKVYVAFVHSSSYKFLLGVTDIRLGEIISPLLEGRNEGRHFLDAADDANISFSVSNFGYPCTITRVTVVNTDAANSMIAELTDIDIPLGSGQTKGFTLPVDIDIDSPYKYEVSVQTSEGKIYKLFSDVLNRSVYKRRMLVEKYTGFWCNSCPRANLPAFRAIDHLGDECIYIEVHNDLAGADPAPYNVYVTNMPSATYYKVAGEWPALWFNRAMQAPLSMRPYDESAFDQALRMPCTTKLDLQSSFSPDMKTVTAHADVTFAEEIDNTDEHLRLSFVLTENKIELPSTSVKQWNSTAGAGAYFGESHYCPSPINPRFTPLHDVVRGPESAGIGIEHLLPAEVLEAGKCYSLTYTLDLPETPLGDGNYNLIANVIDTSEKSFPVLNAAKIRISEATGISAVETSSNDILLTAEGDAVSVSFPSEDDYTLRIYAGDGRLLRQTKGVGSHCSVSGLPIGNLLIVKASQGTAVKSAKIILH